MIEAFLPARDDFSSAWTLGDKITDGAFGSVYRATPVRSVGERGESRPDSGAAPASYTVKRFPKEGVDELFALQVVNEV